MASVEVDIDVFLRPIAPRNIHQCKITPLIQSKISLVEPASSHLQHMTSKTPTRGLMTNSSCVYNSVDQVYLMAKRPRVVPLGPTFFPPRLHINKLYLPH